MLPGQTICPDYFHRSDTRFLDPRSMHYLLDEADEPAPAVRKMAHRSMAGNSHYPCTTSTAPRQSRVRISIPWQCPRAAAHTGGLISQGAWRDHVPYRHTDKVSTPSVREAPVASTWRKDRLRRRCFPTRAISHIFTAEAELTRQAATKLDTALGHAPHRRRTWKTCCPTSSPAPLSKMRHP